MESGKLVLAEGPIFWPKARLERASVNSFGLVGLNAHVIINSAAIYKAPAGPRTEQQVAQFLLYASPNSRSRHSSTITKLSLRTLRRMSRILHTRLLVARSICLILHSPS